MSRSTSVKKWTSVLSVPLVLGVVVAALWESDDGRVDLPDYSASSRATSSPKPTPTPRLEEALPMPPLRDYDAFPGLPPTDDERDNDVDVSSSVESTPTVESVTPTTTVGTIPNTRKRPEMPEAVTFATPTIPPDVSIPTPQSPVTHDTGAVRADAKPANSRRPYYALTAYSTPPRPSSARHGYSSIYDSPQVDPDELYQVMASIESGDGTIEENPSLISSVCCDPVWTVRAALIVMKRQNPKSFTILEDAGTGVDFLNAADYSFDYELGVDISVIRRLNEKHAIEARFFGIDGWSDSRFVRISPETIINTDPSLTLVDCNFNRSTYDSELWSTEVNWRCLTCCKPDACYKCVYCKDITFLAGFRYMELNEDLQLLCGTDPTDPQISLDFDTDNRLYGFQIGADATLLSCKKFRIDGLIKGGIYYNSARHRGRAEFPIGTVFGAPINESKDQVAFIGELSLTADYQLTKWLALRGGYQALWAAGVALASEQISESNFAVGSGIDTGGSVIYHGAVAGLEATW